MRIENLDPTKMTARSDQFFDDLQALSPSTEAQRFAQAQALQLGTDILQTRMMFFEQSVSPVPWPFVVILISWITVLFLGFGLFARLHMTVACALLIGALSVSAAVFLILELNQPYSGFIQLSDAPLVRAAAAIGAVTQR